MLDAAGLIVSMAAVINGASGFRLGPPRLSPARRASGWNGRVSPHAAAPAKFAE
jgi:hypothetical protein